MERMIATTLAGGRTAVGIAALLAPGRFGRLWIGPAADDPAVRVVMRAFGVRDVALGAGALLSLHHGRGVRGWIEAGALADGVDALARLAAGSHIPSRGRWGIVAIATAAAVIGGVVARGLDDDGDGSEPVQDDGPLWLPREPARH